MISDKELNSLAIFLGTLMMALIVLYHFLAVNSSDNAEKVAAEAAAESSSTKKVLSRVAGAAPVVVSK